MTEKGSSFLFPSRRKYIIVVTFVLFAVGIVSASLLLYQTHNRSQSPINVSEEDAITVALADASNNGFKLSNDPNERVESTELIHVKNNGFAFVVDQQTLEDTLKIAEKMGDKYENYYIWKVKMHNADNPNDEWESWIDATNGSVLLFAIDGGVIKEKD